MTYPNGEAPAACTLAYTGASACSHWQCREKGKFQVPAVTDGTSLYRQGYEDASEQWQPEDGPPPLKGGSQWLMSTASAAHCNDGFVSDGTCQM
jgi:hypothetical protein